MIANILAGILSGVAGALGIGGGGILIIYLAMFAKCSQLQAQGINLLFFLPCGIIAIIIHSLKKRIDWKNALWFISGGIPGAAAGFLLTSVIGTQWLGRIFAALLILLGLKGVFTK